jgi:hypothetical protein
MYKEKAYIGKTQMVFRSPSLKTVHIISTVVPPSETHNATAHCKGLGSLALRCTESQEKNMALAEQLAEFQVIECTCPYTKQYQFICY